MVYESVSGKSRQRVMDLIQDFRSTTP
jgi:hypothetical protein